MRESLEQYIQRHRETAAGRTVAEYLDLLAGNEFTLTPDVRAYLDDLWNRVSWVPFP